VLNQRSQWNNTWKTIFLVNQGLEQKFVVQTKAFCNFICLDKQTHKMSFLRDLASGEGCDADISSSSANNPLRNMTSTFLGDSRNAMHANEIDNLIDDNVQQQQQKGGMQTFGKKFGNAKASTNMQFSPQEQMKARGRSEMLARHLFAGA